jgi:GT2 family glycosyltransferase
VSRPAVTVAVATRNRPLRLRWLLNALNQQTFPSGRFEVIVAHDTASPEVRHLLHTHPLNASGRLRIVTFPPLSSQAGAKRNAAWRASRAPLVLFTDDDCRPAPDWVERAVAAAERHPHSILQGETHPDPDERAILSAPWVHTVHVTPPTPWAETCNIAYPRALLERTGGFDERLTSGEDSDLAARAKSWGAPLIATPEMRVYHAVEERYLPATLRALTRWGDMALVAKRHPHLRRDMYGLIWWKREHAALAAAAVGIGLARSNREALVLGLPWIVLSLRHRGFGPRGIVRSLTELPGRAAIDGTELLILARGSIRHRTLLL